MNRDKTWVGAAAVVAVALVVWYARGDAPVQQGVARRPVEPPAASFRITLGIGDSAPQAWDGEVIPASGQAEVEEDELRLHKYPGPGSESGPDPDLPSDRITHDRRHWIASTRPAPRRSTASPLVIEPPSVLVHLRSGAENAPVEVRTVRGSFRFTPAELPLFRPASFLDGKVRVERVPPVAAIAQEQLGHQDLPAVWATRSGDLWVAWQEYDDTADAVYARRRGRTGWEPAWRLDSGRDVFGVAVAEDGRGNIWVIWSMQVNGNWDLYGRFHDGRSWSASERLTSAAGPDVFHRAARDGQGRLWVVWTRPVTGGRTAVFARRREGQGWSAEEEISPPGTAAGNSWFPALACGPTGAAVAWDAYTDGSYNVFLRRFTDGRWGPVETVAGTGLFEAEPAVAIDAQNRVWVAWIESGANWGKDTGFLVQERKGTTLYSSRAVRVACFDGRRLETSSRLEDALGPAEHWEAPQLIAAPGGPWLVLRHMRWRQSDMRTTHAAGVIYWGLWQFHLTRYTGGSWSAPVRLPRSGSRNDGKAAATVDPSGTLWLVWATDQRDTRAYLPIQNRVELAQIALPASSAEPQLVPAASAAAPAFSPIHPREAEQVGRIRSYRIDHGGKRYGIYRGDLHRHTEISIDGSGDGSLFDTYRYARDAAALDFLGVTDHTHDVVEPYAWWRSQKVADLFQIQNAFAAFYAYERSVEYPNGHRNVVFVRRGIDVLPIEYDEANGWEGSERLFWVSAAQPGSFDPSHVRHLERYRLARQRSGSREIWWRSSRGCARPTNIPEPRARSVSPPAPSRAPKIPACARSVLSGTPWPRAIVSALSPLRTTCRRTSVMPV